MAGPSLQGLVNPAAFVWARKASGVDLEAAARRIGVKEEKLRAWESGDKFPTLTQLRALAGVYKRSVGVFFLDELPGALPQPADFRRLELSVPHVVSPQLANSIREAEAKRDAALDIFNQWEEEPPAFATRSDPDASPEQVAKTLLNALHVTMGRRRQWGDEYDALNAWKAAVESLGVLVMQVSGVAVSEMRGCSLALFPLPVILLNSKDRPLGRVFSLLHELVHLARAESGLCDVIEDVHRGDDEQMIEALCNHVAGAMLVPAEELLRQPAVLAVPGTKEWNSDELRELRGVFWASREAILRRLLIVGKTTQHFYQAEHERLKQQYATDEGESSGGFAKFPRRVVLANGRFLTGLVVDAYDANVITGSQLSRILGTKLDHLPNILDVLRERQAA